MTKTKLKCWNAVLRDRSLREKKFRVCAKSKPKALEKAIKKAFKIKDMAIRLEKTK